MTTPAASGPPCSASRRATGRSRPSSTRRSSPAGRPKSCRPTLGRVEVCNANYRNTGWLGLAQIWIYSDGHIAQGIVKNNDYYFGNSSYQYNNKAEMQHVICQEIGHTFGLDHRARTAALRTPVWTTTTTPATAIRRRPHPNTHDYQQLSTIYTHLDSSNSYDNTSAAFLPDAVPSFAAANRVSQVEYVDDLGNGRKLVTWVFWAE